MEFSIFVFAIASSQRLFKSPWRSNLPEDGDMLKGCLCYLPRFEPDKRRLLTPSYLPLSSVKLKGKPLDKGWRAKKHGYPFYYIRVESDKRDPPWIILDSLPPVPGCIHDLRLSYPHIFSQFGFFYIYYLCLTSFLDLDSISSLQPRDLINGPNKEGFSSFSVPLSSLFQ